RPGQVLLASDVPFGSLDGCVSQKELNLLQFAARCVAQSREGSPEVVGGQRRDSGTGRTGLHDIPDYVLGDTVAPHRSVLPDRAEQCTIDDRSTFGPAVDRGLYPSRYGYCSHMTGFADQVDDRPVILALLNVANLQRNNLRSTQPTAKEEGDDGAIAFLP